jgi:hypothetical protein
MDMRQAMHTLSGDIQNDKQTAIGATEKIFHVLYA